MEIKEWFNSPKAKTFWINIACIIGVLVIIPTITLYYLDYYTHHGERIEVPSVDKMTLEKAEEVLSRYGLVAVVTDSVKKKGYLPGTVCLQTPKAGSEVKDGRMVYLTVIRTTETMVNFPDVVGNNSVDEARQILHNLGFTFTPDKEVVSEAEGMVVNVYQGNKKLYANQSVSTSYPITLYVGSGIQEENEEDEAIGTDDNNNEADL